MTNVNRLEAVEPDPREVSRFWAQARKNVGWAGLEVILGQQQEAVVEPPWMHLSQDREEATLLVNALAEAGKGVAQTPISEFPGGEEDLPSPGDLAVICDGDGNPVALVMTVNLDVLDVTAASGAPEVAGGLGVPEVSEALGGQGDGSLPEGNRVRIVEERFRSLYPRLKRKTLGSK